MNPEEFAKSLAFSNGA